MCVALTETKTKKFNHVKTWIEFSVNGEKLNILLIFQISLLQNACKYLKINVGRRGKMWSSKKKFAI